MIQKFRPLALSILLLLVSIGTYQTGNYFLERATQSPETPAGTWQQYVVDSDGAPIYLATFRFDEVDSDFAVQALDIGPNTFPRNNFRTFGHEFDGQTWTFQSDWHQYGIATFRLRKGAADGSFEGYAYLNGVQQPNRHILLRHDQEDRQVID